MSLELATQLDSKYPSYRDLFCVPTFESMGTANLTKSNSSSNTSQNPDKADLDNKSITYFCGNSLGLMPKNTGPAVNAELLAWQSRGVVGHFRREDLDAREPWVSIDAPVGPLLAPVLGAKYDSEVAVMNTLTGNLHALMSVFYRPKPNGSSDSKNENKRFKILMEEKAFPSDQYALQGQARLHGYDPKDAIIEVRPRDGEYTLRTEDILDAIEEHKDELAVVLFSGIQYYTGQLFEIEKITSAGQKAGAVVGWDLAHAAGNVPLKLHDWNVDFAVFCSYKYLNSGPGGIGGIFVHSKHDEDDSTNNSSRNNDKLARQAGWWGNEEKSRFQMKPEFNPIPGAKGFRMSNPSVLNVVCITESLKLFQLAGGIEKLSERSQSMTGLLFKLLGESQFYVPVESFQSVASGSKGPKFTIITPQDPQQRGAQLSLMFSDGIMQTVFDKLEQQGIIGDERQPSVIRLAPNHFYNTHVQVFEVVKAVESILNQLV